MALTLQDIAQSMRRVRFGEAGFQGRDHKTVWHQATDGCELVTRVDREGRVLEHEFSLRGSIAVWKRDQTVRTGTLRGHDHSAEERLGGPQAALIDLDDAPRWAVVEDAAMLAELVPGNDRYLAHLASVMRAAVAGAAAGGEPVTTVSGMKRPAQVTGAMKQMKSGKGFSGLLRRLLGR